MKNIFKSKKSNDLFQLLIGFIIIILINILATAKFKRFDLTSEGRYSLSDSTISILDKMEDKVLVTVYLESKDLNVGFKRLRNATQEILEEFRFYSKSNFEYRFVDPFENANEEEQMQMYSQLIDKGLTPTDIMEKDAQGQKVKQVFPGAIIAYNEKEIPVQLLESQFGQSGEMVLNQSIERLEYNLSKGLYKALNYQKKKTVAFTRGHGEMYEANLADIVNDLREYYEVVAVDIDNNLNTISPQKVQCLVIVQPDTMFDDASKFAIDQYIMNGGSVLWLVDNVFSSLDSVGNKDYTVAMARDLGLYDQLFKYGVRINPTIVQDEKCAKIRIDYGKFGTQKAEDLFDWFYYPVIVPDGDHPIVKNINAIKLEFANSIDTIKTPGIKKTILLHTSEMTKVLYTPTRISLQTIEEKATPQNFSKSNIPVAVLLEGEFSSVFSNRIVELSDRKFIPKSKPNTKMIVVSDGDIIKNAYNRKTEATVPLGLDPSTGVYYAGNKTFILNAINYLTDDTWFVPLRSKDFRIRMLDKKKVKSAKFNTQLVNTIVPVFIIAAFGIIYNYIRRRKYA